MTTDEKLLVSYLSQNSPLAQNTDQFEERPEQIAMLKAIVKAYNEKNFALIEAGTGIGKSLAYLLPSMITGALQGARTVVSTHTITLQEQLVLKDIPFISKALNLDIEPVIVKGMGNYLCLRKLGDLRDSSSLQPSEEQQEIEHIVDWSRETTDGSLSDLKMFPKQIGWEKFNCESDACSFVKCPYYSQCFFFKARKQCKDAKLLIANHHVLLADLKMQSIDSNTQILPDYEQLVVDEAHTLEDIATQSLASSISSQYLLRKLGDLITDRGQTGKLQRLKKILSGTEEEPDTKIAAQLQELFTEKRHTQSLVIEEFTLLSEFLDQHVITSDQQIGKKTLTDTLRNLPAFEKVQEGMQSLIDQLNGFSLSVSSLIERCEELKEKPILKQLQNIFIDTRSIVFFLEKTAGLLSDFFNPEKDEHKIYVIEWNTEKSLYGLRLLIIQLNIADVLSTFLFAPRDSAILCSATLTHNQQFSFIKQQIGFNDTEIQLRGIQEVYLESPFEYQKKVLLATPSDIPAPASYGYQQKLCDAVFAACTASQGGAFVLFTSYKLLNECYKMLAQNLIDEGLLPLKQGDESRNTLLTIFKENPNAVLFGTDTFWEGIDVPGFHLRLVIITKLPFPVPSEPIFQAKCEQIEQMGKNSFMDYALPKAIVKFKQGFGRLVRTKDDFGVILCLDSRLIQKRYGQSFIRSLPTCMQLMQPQAVIEKKIKEFYQSHGTWSVTESNR